MEEGEHADRAAEPVGPGRSDDIGRQLKWYRRRLGLTQEALGERVGYSTAYVKKLEAGARCPSPVVVSLFAEALELTAAERDGFARVALRMRRAGLTTVIPPSNLPAQVTGFVGREREISEVSELLRRAEARLITLTGSPGVGKTRLALEVAAHGRGTFPDGTFFVALAPVADAGAVASTVASALDIRQPATTSPTQALIEHLRDKEVLLILDNFEHLLDVAPVVSELLRACPGLTVLATSREPLHLYGEYEYVVPPLAVPDPEQRTEIFALLGYEAVALFGQRGEAARRDFALTTQNAREVAAICARLDGLPLAIELAAAQLRAMPVEAMLPRLEPQLDLLTGGPADTDPRHRALRATIEWSYTLLDPNERAFFRRLGVFVGGCTLEAAEAVCHPEGPLTAELPRLMTSLVTKSLVQADGQGGARQRFRMLETVRTYALEKLNEAGEMSDMRRRHAEYFLALAERAETEMQRHDQVGWLGRLEEEHDNLRTALEWFRAEGEVGAIEGYDSMARLASTLSSFWLVHAHHVEARTWLKMWRPACGRRSSRALQ